MNKEQAKKLYCNLPEEKEMAYLFDAGWDACTKKMQEEFVVDIYNNPLHAEIFKATHRLAVKHTCPMIEASNDELKAKIQALENKLLKITILGSGEKAYTRDFTTEVMGIVRS